MNVSVALIAGGHSRRMGRDKALLPHPLHGTLLQRQLHVLECLGASETLISCRSEQVLPLPSNVRRIHDAGTHGPLAGLAALLTAARGDHLLVLGIDLGKITPAFLQRLVAAMPSPHAAGVVPRTRRGFEPLAAVYPTSLAANARHRLESGDDLSLQSFVRAAVSSGLLTTLAVSPDDEPLLENWNTPDDLPGSRAGT